MDGWWKVSGKGGIMCMRIDGMGMENRFCEDDGMVWLVVELGCGIEEYHQLTSGYWHQLQVERENSQLKMANGSPLVPENSHYQEHEWQPLQAPLELLTSPAPEQLHLHNSQIYHVS